MTLQNPRAIRNPRRIIWQVEGCDGWHRTEKAAAAACAFLGWGRVVARAFPVRVRGKICRVPGCIATVGKHPYCQPHREDRAARSAAYYYRQREIAERALNGVNTLEIP